MFRYACYGLARLTGSAALLALPMQLVAQQTDSARRVAPPSISGVVHDSISAAVLARASVQIVSADAFARFGRTTIADSLGRFAFGDVPPGRYMLGFFHPVLDSIGIEAPLREVRVQGSGEPVRADLAVPSAARIRAAMCGGDTKNVGGALIGVVREARDSAPAVGVAVTGEWIEVSIGASGVASRLQRLVATTGENGRFVMCSVPNAGLMTIIASRGADSTDRIDVQVPPSALMRHELFIDSARGVASYVSGVVVAQVGGQPLGGAHVSVGTSASARTNERGEWTLANVPVGTRMLDVRAIGYYPDRRAIDVASGGPVLRVALATLRSVLDTVKVTASRPRIHDLVGFQERRRTGVGRYVTAEQMKIRTVLNTSDVFRSFPGVRIGVFDDTLEADMTPERPQNPGPRDKILLMRGVTTIWCAASVWLDGSRFEGIGLEDIDAWVQPKEVAGIEVYMSSTTPIQYQRAMNGCGAILIWTRQ